MSTSPRPPLECLELDHVVLRVRDQAASQRFYTEMLGLTLDHICLSVRCDDLGAVVGYLRARGVPVEGEIVSRRGAFGDGPSVYIRDPDGYRIELKLR